MQSSLRVFGPPASMVVALVSAVSLTLAAPTARAAEVVIKQPAAHLDYSVELEPHLNLAFMRTGFGKFKGSEKSFGAPELGGGFRATIELGDPAFIPKLNNTVGITFGADITGCPSGCSSPVRVRAPIGLQWNFFITREFSAFADLGFMLRMDAAGLGPDIFAMAGARYLFNERESVTLRLGYPFVSVGVSFFRG